METAAGRHKPAVMDPTLRFSSRVGNYVRYRPGYPREIISLLKAECGLTSDSIIADVGSGTGKLVELFLANGNQVFGVEPNREMREAGERLLSLWPSFTSVAGTAEATTLADQSVDFIAAGQAFHWFDRERSRAEFKRILKPRGWTVLVWNDRHTNTTPFLIEYERLLLTHGTDYTEVNHKHIDKGEVRAFFQREPRKKVFPNFQEFDFTGLKGRLLSSSYVPEEGQPKHAEMLRELEKLFERHNRNNHVRFDYDTVVYYERLP